MTGRRDVEGAGAAPATVWTATVPAAATGSVVPAGDLLVVRSGGEMLVLALDGRLLWSSDEPGIGRYDPVVLDDVVVTADGTTVSWFDLRTGALIRSVPAGGASAPVVRPGTGEAVVAARWSGGADRRAAPALVGLDVDGVVWTVPLERWPEQAPVPVGAAVAVDRGDDVLLVTPPVVGPGVGTGGGTVRVAALTPRIRGESLMAVDDGRLLVAGRYDRALVDLGTATGSAVACGEPCGPPWCVVPGMPSGTGATLVATGGPVEVAYGDWRWPVVALPLDGGEGGDGDGDDGGPRWTRRFPTEPRRLDPGPDGHVLVTSTPTARRWQDYGEAYDLRAFVVCVDGAGEERWRWRAPAAITHGPAVTPDGRVVVVAGDTLHSMIM